MTNGSPPLRFLLGAGALFVVLVGLGLWQMKGWLTVTEIRTLHAARLALPPVGLPADPGRPALWMFRHVQVEGRFAHEHEITVPSGPLDGRAGHHVLTPLLLPKGGVLFVDRGWVPPERKEPAARPEAAPPSALTGILRLPQSRALFTPDNQGAAWHRIDPLAMAAAKGLAGALPYYLELDEGQGGPTGPQGGHLLPAAPGRALLFAGAWFALAAGVLAIIVVRLRRKS